MVKVKLTSKLIKIDWIFKNNNDENLGFKVSNFNIIFFIVKKYTLNTPT
jgi:hypothetical protein